MPSVGERSTEMPAINALIGGEGEGQGEGEGRNDAVSPSKTRSLSDTTPSLSPSPKFREPTKRASKDDSVLQDSPTTPRRPAFLSRLSLQMPPRDLMSPTSAHVNRPPLSPQLDHSDTYGSQASVLPRRSRGLDFSRAATNLHHSTLAEQSSPDSSPTLTGRAMNIPNRRNGTNFSGIVDLQNGNTSSLWSTVGHSDRMNASSSLGSVSMMDAVSSSSDSDNEDMMDADDIDDSILTTPQISRNSGPFGMGAQPSPGNMWMNGQSPAVSSLMSFQRARLRNGRNRKSSSSASGSSMNSPGSRSPPIRSIEGASSGYFTKDSSRRESISWAANQLHISGSESEDGNRKGRAETEPVIPRDGTRGVVRRAVTRRGNMLPKTKGFARVRAALLEEGAPIETEFRREADVVRQVRESDSDLQPSLKIRSSTNATHSSPNLIPSVSNAQESLEDIPEDMLMVGETPQGDKLSSSFKQQAMRNSKGKEFWETFDGINSTPPPPSFLPRASSISDDMSMDSPSNSNSTPSSLYTTTSSSQIFNTAAFSNPPNIFPESQQPSLSHYAIPSAAEISRKVNNKRRRNNDDFDDDPANFKRRAVSPGSAMSVHNSPVLQSPMQRDVHPWGSRPTASAGTSATANTGGGASDVNSNGNTNGTPAKGAPKRVGMQGMADTNDGLMKMSID